MKKKICIFLLLLMNVSVHAQSSSNNVPAFMKGDFKDDYGIQYSISDTLFTQWPNINYHIISWDTTAQYLLARNDDKNPGEAGLYTRIDFMTFKNMAPFLWGFCLTVYDATTLEEAKTSAQPDRINPKTGCNGYPFSRMKRSE